MLVKGGGAMEYVKIERLKILSIVKDNREKHIQEYKETEISYLQKCEERAKEILKISKTKDIEKVNKIRWELATPRSYEKEYDRAIRMLELSCDDVIELSSDVFNQLVLDEWSWKSSFVSTSQMYKN